MMKNTLFKNLAKSMEHYGEMLNRIGCCSQPQLIHLNFWRYFYVF